MTDDLSTAQVQTPKGLQWAVLLNGKPIVWADDSREAAKWKRLLEANIYMEKRKSNEPASR